MSRHQADLGEDH
jgi:hypothetical protein